MTHDQAVTELSAYLDGELDAAARKGMEAHLDGCAGCRSHLEELRAAVALFKAHARKEAPAFLESRVLARARASVRPAEAGPFRLWKPALALSFVAAAALFIAVPVVKKAMPGLFSQSQGMISGAAGSLGTLELESEESGSLMPMAERPVGGESGASGFMQDRIVTPGEWEAPENRVVAPSRMRLASRPNASMSLTGAQKSVAGGAAGAGAGAGLREGLESVPTLNVFRDGAQFESHWKTLTQAPAPRVDFTRFMVVVLSEPPHDRQWAILTEEVGPGEIKLFYQAIPLPSRLPDMSVVIMQPAFKILPVSDKNIVLQKAR